MERLGVIEARKHWYLQNKEKVWGQRIFNTYGITSEQYYLIEKHQKFKCAICETDKPQIFDKWQIDHCHKTNNVRGLLCENCNKLLGYAKDNQTILKNAIMYLNVIN